MRMSADFCRAQAALHRGKAESDPLENRRKIALDAAKAWEIEAVAADERDAKVKPLTPRDTAIAQEFARETDADRKD